MRRYCRQYRNCLPSHRLSSKITDKALSACKTQYHSRCNLSTPSLRIFSAPALLGVLGLKQCCSHNIDHGGAVPAVVQSPAHFVDITRIILQHMDCVHLPGAMRPDILRQPQCLFRSFHIAPNGLTASVLRRVASALEHPDLTAARAEFAPERLGQVHAPALPRL